MCQKGIKTPRAALKYFFPVSGGPHCSPEDLYPPGFLSQERGLQKRELFVIKCQCSIVESTGEAGRDAHTMPQWMASSCSVSLFPHAGSEENGREELKAPNVAKHFCIGSRQCRGV